MERRRPLSVTDLVMAEHQRLEEEMQRAKEKASEIVESSAGPWAYKELMDSIMEQAGVGRNSARGAEDELIRDHQLRRVGWQLIRSAPAIDTPAV